MTAPGIPMLFRGQEMLEDGWSRDDDAIDWTKKDRSGGIVRMCRDVIALRRNVAGTTRGLRGGNVNVFHVNDPDDVIAFHRWAQGGAGDDVPVVLNFGAAAPSALRPRHVARRHLARPLQRRKGYDAAFDATASNDTTSWAASRDALGYTASGGLGPYGAVILSQ